MRSRDMAVTALGAWIGLAGHASASVDRIEVKSREAFHTSRIGPYVKVEGVFTGSLNPKTEVIPGLDKAGRRADGRVAEYRSDFIVLAPEAPAAGNRVLLFDVENNGRPVVHGMCNSPLESIVRGLEIGNGFLEDQGFIIAVVSWQDGQGITLPAYPGADGKPVPLLAVGFAAVRDFAAFLRFAEHDGAGTANPVAGRLARAVAAGSSQTARFLKSFLHHGFNQAGDRTIFDGLHLQVGQVGSMPFMPPAGADQDVVKQTLVGDSAVYPFTYQDVFAPLAARKEVPPKILATNVEGGLLPAPTVAFPDRTVGHHRRRAAGFGTGLGYCRWIDGIVLEDNCEMPRANLDWHPVPPRWSSGTGAMGPRRRSARPVASDAARQGRSRSDLSVAPKDQPKAIMMVPSRDADGNGEGGLRLPAIAVPLGTHGAWNAPLANNCGDMSTFWHPFPRSRWQRLMTGDARQAVQERYPSADEVHAALSHCGGRARRRRLPARKRCARAGRCCGSESKVTIPFTRNRSALTDLGLRPTESAATAGGGVSVAVRILVALVAGLGVGFLLRGSSVATMVIAIADPIGQMWINGLRMCAVPLVFSCLVVSVGSMQDTAALGRLGRRAIWFFLILLTTASLFSAAVSWQLLKNLDVPPDVVASLAKQHRMSTR